MKSCCRLSAALLLGALSSISTFAQEQSTTNSATPAPPPAQAGTADTLTLKPGTFLVAEFIGGLNAGKLKPGDKVRASLTQELIAQGKVIATEEARIFGHVTEARPHGEQGESRLGIIFDKLMLKHHKEMHFVASIYLLEPPSSRPSRVDRPSQMLPPSMLGPGPSTNSGQSAQVGRGVTGTAGRAPAQSASTSNTISAMSPVNSPIVVGGTPGSTMGDKNVPASLPQTQSANNAPASAAKGIRPGVYGIKNLALGPKDNETPGLVILSKESTIKLEDGTQVVLMIMGPAPIVASK
jgi:hypothetical protein